MTILGVILIACSWGTCHIKQTDGLAFLLFVQAMQVPSLYLKGNVRKTKRPYSLGIVLVPVISFLSVGIPSTSLFSTILNKSFFLELYLITELFNKAFFIDLFVLLTASVSRVKELNLRFSKMHMIFLQHS